MMRHSYICRHPAKLGDLPSVRRISPSRTLCLQLKDKVELWLRLTIKSSQMGHLYHIPCPHYAGTIMKMPHSVFTVPSFPFFKDLLLFYVYSSPLFTFINSLWCFPAHRHMYHVRTFLAEGRRGI